jgi:hypothetical protein
MTMNEYLNRFTQLSRYASNVVNIDEKKQDAFLNGLNDEIQFQLLNTDYEHFWRMVDKAIIVENYNEEMEKNGKRKMVFPGQSSGSNTRPRLPQPVPFADAWLASYTPDVVTELPRTTLELPDAETSAASTSTQCVVTISPEQAARPPPQLSHRAKCTSPRKP